MRGSAGARATGVTSHDVANEAGVSQATVARVFSSPDKVASATKARVLEVADRLGYVPNAIARSLKSQRTDIVGAVVPATGEYWQHVLTAFSRQLTERGRQLLLFSFDEPDQVAVVVQTVAQYRLDGLIAASASIGPQHLVRIDRSTMPVVAFNQPAASGLMPSVSVDNDAGMRALADHVIERGVRSAVFVGGVASASTDRIRYRGAASRLAERGVACPYIEAGAFTYEAGYKVAGQLTDQSLVDAIMVGSDEVAFGLIDGLRERGIEAPNDVLITGFDGLPQSRWAGYDLTTLEQPTELLVEHAISAIFSGAAVPGSTGSAARPTESSSSVQGTQSESHTEPAEVIVPGTVRQGRTTDHA